MAQTSRFSKPRAPSEEEVAIFQKFEAKIRPRANVDENEAISVISCSTSEYEHGSSIRYLVKIAGGGFHVFIFRGLSSPDDFTLNDVIGFDVE